MNTKNGDFRSVQHGAPLTNYRINYWRGSCVVLTLNKKVVHVHRTNTIRWRCQRERKPLVATGKACILKRDRIRALMAAVALDSIAWTGFYWTYGNHQITSLDEFSSSLKGEDLYRKSGISYLT